MSIKGTLETFNLLDLLQMLAFNQKVGTLVVETAAGPRTLFVENGSFGFVSRDPGPSRGLARVIRREGRIPPERIQRAMGITANSGRFLGDVLVELGVMDADARRVAWLQAFQDLFFDLLQTPLSRFEFVENRRLAPDGGDGEPIQPLGAVDGMLLDLTRKLDEWAVLRVEVPDDGEVYERSGRPLDLTATPDIPTPVVERAMPLFDGSRPLSAVVEESDGDRFNVVKLAAAALRGGALRPAKTPDLLARAEAALGAGAAAAAVPLLRRALDHGDAPPTTRVRLADALEACGRTTEAADELDAFAAADSTKDPNGTFDALWRVHGLRGDAGAAGRVCDHYLAHRARMPDRLPQATEALRTLVQTASTHGHALEAANRLAQFIERGDAPSEDLLVLADLYAAGDRLPEAAATLVRRAELLLALGRVEAARDLYRRALAYDSRRSDARRRLADLESAERRRRHRRRMLVLCGLVGLVVASAGGVYLTHDGRAARIVEEALADADTAAAAAEARVQAALTKWNEAVGSASTATTLDPSAEPVLVRASAALRAAAKVAAGDLRAAMYAASARIAEAAGSSGRADTGRERLEQIEGRIRTLVLRAENAEKDLFARGAEALSAGEKAFRDGHFEEARALLRQSANLLYTDRPEIRTQADQARGRLEQVEASLKEGATLRSEIEAAQTRGEFDEAWRAAGRLFRRFRESDLTRDVLLSVTVRTTPAGATLRLGDEALEAPTPCTVRYSPFGARDLHVRLPAYAPSVVNLPSWRTIVDGTDAGTLCATCVSVKLNAGPRWTASLRGGPVTGPFLATDDANVLVVADDGDRVVRLAVADGQGVELRRIAPGGERLRATSRGLNGTWSILGQRTFQFSPTHGTAWSVPTVGRLDRAPAFGSGLVVIVDESGVVYGVASDTGVVRWRVRLEGRPVQPPFVSPMGFLLATTAGEAVAVRPDGRVLPLAPSDARRGIFALPWRDGALVVGGGAAGLYAVDAAGARTPIGEADPDVSIAPSVVTDAVAWVERGGRARVRTGDGRLVSLEGLGAVARAVALADGKAFAIGADGVLRAVRVEAPKDGLWSVRAPEGTDGAPLAVGDVLVVRSGTSLYAYDR